MKPNRSRRYLDSDKFKIAITRLVKCSFLSGKTSTKFVVRILKKRLKARRCFYASLLVLLFMKAMLSKSKVRASVWAFVKSLFFPTNFFGVFITNSKRMLSDSSFSLSCKPINRKKYRKQVLSSVFFCSLDSS